MAAYGFFRRHRASWGRIGLRCLPPEHDGLWCPVAYLPHLLLGHLLLIALLTMLGAAGGFVLRPKQS